MRHAILLNGTFHGLGKDGLEVDRALANLDGRQRASFLLHGVPDSFEQGRDSLNDYSKEYLQSAGSAHRMSLELRRLVDGEYRHFAVGREGEYEPSPPALEETIEWAGRQLRLQACEVFDAAAAAPIYHHYRSTGGDLPPGLVLRPVEV